MKAGAPETVGDPSKAIPTASESAAATTPATKANKTELLLDYVRLFCCHVEDKVKDPQGRIANLHLFIISSAQRGNYSTVDEIHADYDMLYDRVLSGSPDLVEKVSNELMQFSMVGKMWWPFCYKLPLQEKRHAYLKEVVELIKSDEGRASVLYQKVRNLRKVYDPVVDLDSEWVEEDELMAAMEYM